MYICMHRRPVLVVCLFVVVFVCFFLGGGGGELTLLNIAVRLGSAKLSLYTLLTVAN